MHTEDAVVYDGSHWEMIEKIYEGFPKFSVITTFAFVIETVYFGNVFTFMITPKQVNVSRILYFVSEQ